MFSSKLSHQNPCLLNPTWNYLLSLLQQQYTYTLHPLYVMYLCWLFIIAVCISGSSQSTIYKIPLSCLAGHISNDRLNQRKPSSTPLLAPITNGDKTQVKRSPLVRSKGGLHPPIYLEQVSVNINYITETIKIIYKKNTI